MRIPSRHRQHRPPDTVLAALQLKDHERALAWATDAEGRWYVGTNLALHLPAGTASYRRLPWEEVQRADWDQDAEQLTIVEVAERAAPEPASTVAVTDPGRLLELIRERVTNSVVCTLYAKIRGREGVTVVGRRPPSGGEPVRWSYVLSPTLDPADPGVVEVVRQTMEAARREVEGL